MFTTSNHVANWHSVRMEALLTFFLSGFRRRLARSVRPSWYPTFRRSSSPSTGGKAAGRGAGGAGCGSHCAATGCRLAWPSQHFVPTCRRGRHRYTCRYRRDAHTVCSPARKRSREIQRPGTREYVANDIKRAGNAGVAHTSREGGESSLPPWSDRVGYGFLKPLIKSVGLKPILPTSFAVGTERQVGFLRVHRQSGGVFYAESMEKLGYLSTLSPKSELISTTLHPRLRFAQPALVAVVGSNPFASYAPQTLPNAPGATNKPPACRDHAWQPSDQATHTRKAATIHVHVL